MSSKCLAFINGNTRSSEDRNIPARVRSVYHSIDSNIHKNMSRFDILSVSMQIFHYIYI